ncbi:hypothetical protein ACQVPJ_26260 [Bacillus mycoides]|uniref:Uncharacterized protein n=1 Tax=Bacillus cereus VD021 TaxID=1053224 RepID=R8GY38_BACCE|nr:hypothetical protein [Bacillus cereus]EOO65508.1 hypothetical protein IIC_06118 [Bacillus cereus VD021]
MNDFLYKLKEHQKKSKPEDGVNLQEVMKESVAEGNLPEMLLAAIEDVIKKPA